MTAFLIWLPGWLLALDAIRRPAEQWVRADRNRPFWVALLALFSPVLVLPYLIGVLPRLATAGTERGDFDLPPTA